MRVAPEPVTKGSSRIPALLLVAVKNNPCAASSSPPPGVTPVTVMSVAAPSSTSVTSLMKSKDGPSFTAFTVTMNVAVAVLTDGATESPPSVAVTVIVATPFASAAGCIVSVHVVPEPDTTGSATSAGASLAADRETDCMAPSSSPPPTVAPAMVTVNWPESSSIVTSFGASNVGASFTASTVTVTVAVTLSVKPSFAT